MYEKRKIIRPVENIDDMSANMSGNRPIFSREF